MTSPLKILFGLLLLIIPSCNLLPRATPVPVGSLQGGTPIGSELVLFLPGRWSRVAEFQHEKFFKIAAKRWPNARLQAVDLHLGYYRNRSAARRLHEDIVLTARRSGVKKITLVGVSMGGLGALMYETEYPHQIDSLILIAPFLGENEVIAEIIAAGRLAKWQPSVITERDFSRKLWLRLRRNWQQGGRKPNILLGCGSEDRLAPASHLFAAEFLKSNEQSWLPGGHDWPVWRELFKNLISK